MERISFTECWVGFGLDLASRRDIGDERQVHEERPLCAHLHPQLAGGFQERLRFDIAHGTANLNKGHVHITRAFHNAALDLVGNMGNDLNRAAKIVATAFLTDHLLIDTPAGEVCGGSWWCG